MSVSLRPCSLLLPHAPPAALLPPHKCWRTLLKGLIAIGKHVWQQEEEIKEDSITVLMLQEQLFNSELFRDIKDAILSYSAGQCDHSEQLVSVYLHVGCAFNLRSIISSGLIPQSQSSSKRQTVFFLPVDHMDKSHKNPNVIDLSVPRHAQYLHKSVEETSRRNKLGRHQSCYF